MPATFWYPTGLTYAIQSGLSAADIRVALFTNDPYVFNAAHDFLDDVVGANTELTDYTRGTLGAPTSIAYDPTPVAVELIFTSPIVITNTSSGSTIRGAAYYIEGANDAARRLIGFSNDLSQATAGSNINFTASATDGLLRIVYTPPA